MRSWLGKLLIAPVAAVVAWQAVDMVVWSLRAAADVNLADRIEAGLVPDSAFLDGFDAAHPEDRLDGTCDARIRRARLTIALVRLDLALGGGDLDRTDRARTAALDSAAALIRCVPADGNAWLRRAMVEVAAVGPTPSVMARFDLADRLAPYEGWVLSARLPFYADIGARGIEAFANRARRDLNLLVLYGRDPRRAVATVTRWPDLLLETYRAALDRLPARTRRGHERLADEVGIDIGQEKKRQGPIIPFLDPPGSEGARR